MDIHMLHTKKSFMETLSLSASISKPTFFIFFAHKCDKTFEYMYSYMYYATKIHVCKINLLHCPCGL